MALGAGGGRRFGLIGLVVGFVASPAIHVNGLGVVLQFFFLGEFGSIFALGSFARFLVALDAVLHFAVFCQIRQWFALVIMVAGAAPVLVKVWRGFGIILRMFLVAEFDDTFGMFFISLVLQFNDVRGLGASVDAGSEKHDGCPDDHCCQ